ncbi:MAG: ATP/GTP-binding protein [Gammaproteobacteria bacterium]|nr:ATP/GTP-binding protein [Gammaproteobacteria bacterium]
MQRFTPMILACVLSTATATAQTNPTSLWQFTEGLAQPESVLPLPDAAGYLISNIAGDPGQADGEGYLTRLNADGSLDTLRWVDGLDAPKGMAFSNGQIVVADIKRIHVIDASNGKLLKTHVVDEAVFLNDVTATNDGRVFISDMMTGVIHQLHDDRVTAWFHDAQIPHPNGLAIQGDALLIGNWGTGLQKDFSTSEPGALYAVNLETATLLPEATVRNIGNIDGVVTAGNDVIISDWISGKIIRIRDGQAQTLWTLETGSADIGLAGRTLLVPKMMVNRVDVYSLED